MRVMWLGNIILPAIAEKENSPAVFVGGWMVGLVYKPLSMLLSYLYIPVALAYLGDEKYGVWATVLSVLSWISLFDIGIGNGLRNKLAENLKNYDSLKTRKYVSSAYIMLTIIVMILMIVTVALFSLINWKSFFKVEANFSDNLTIVMNISIICMCVSFVMEICKSVYLALQKNHITNLMGLVQQALMLSSVVVLKKYTNRNLVFVAIAYGISNLVVELFFTLKLFKYNRDFIPRVKYFSREEAKTVLNRAIWPDPLEKIFGGWGLYENGQFTTESIENFILFVPFSSLLLWAFQKELLGESKRIWFGKTVWQVTKIVAVFSFMIEFAQLLFHLGTFQISDLTYNTLGGAVGGVIYFIGYKIISRKNAENEKVLEYPGNTKCQTTGTKP